MKKQILTAVIALTGLAAFTSANAQSSFTQGDAFLLFKTAAGTGNGVDTVIDIGNLTSVGNYTVDLSGSILATTYGPNWYSRTDLFWGIIGANSDGSSTFLTRSLATGIYQSPSTMGTVASNVNNMIGAFTGGNGNQSSISSGISGAPTSLATSHLGATFANSFTIEDKSPNFFGGLGGAIALANFNGTTRTIYDYENFATKSATTASVSITSGGLLTVSAVPEPGTYALFGLGALILVVASRRRNA